MSVRVVFCCFKPVFISAYHILNWQHQTLALMEKESLLPDQMNRKKGGNFEN